MDLRARGGEDLPTSTRRSRGGQPGNTNAVKSGFYSRQVSPSNESHYREALNVEGLHEEIALLRVLIAHQIEEGADTGEISKGMEILVRAVSAQYRMSQKAKDSLTNAISDVLERLGGQMGLEQ